MNNLGTKIAYYLILLPISRLPYFLLYRVSDLFWLVLFYVVGYRKKVVWNNLVNTFPEKSKKEIRKIRRRFYVHLCDLVLESIKNFTVSNKAVNARMKCLNPELPDSFFDQGKNVIFCGGHLNNWEMWAVSVETQVKHQLLGIYKKIKNPFFDKVMHETRSKFGLKLIPTTDVSTIMDEAGSKISAILLLFDQSPSDPSRSHWIRFLNQDTPCFYGPEKHARQYDIPVLYGRVKKVKRGFYETWFEVVTENPLEMKNGEIIERIHALLEVDIRNEPEHWLWSHKRWKHKRDA